MISKRPIKIAITAALALGTIAVPPGWAASSPSPVTITGSGALQSPPSGRGFPNAGTLTGTDTASTPISDTFTFVDHFSFGGPTLHVKRTLTSESGLGTIEMSINGRFTSHTDTSETIDGGWTITSGTGAYATLHGGGSYHATVDRTTETITETLTGFAEYDSGS